MSTDDRDIEPSNPSKSFKVGDFDRLSGFFTPVWESKRKIRSESPVPSSSAAASAPSSTTTPAAPTPSKASAVSASPANAPTGAAGSKGGVLTPSPTLSASAPQKSDASDARVAAVALAPAGRKPGSAAPSAAAVALEQAGPNLPAEAFLDREPDFRPPLPPESAAPRAERGALYRSLRASAAATAVHEKLKAKVQVDSMDSPANYRETDSDREAIRAVAAKAAPTQPDQYPQHLLRRLRRTFHLSTPLPDSIRSVISKYGRK